MRPIRHIRSNAIAYLALFVALGGTGAYASGKIGSSQIKSNAIRSKHIKNGQVKSADLKDGGVGAADIGIGALPHTWASRFDEIVVNVDTPGADCANPSPTCRYLSSTASGGGASGGGKMSTTQLPGSKVDIFLTGSLKVRAPDTDGGEIACLPSVVNEHGVGYSVGQNPIADFWGMPNHGNNLHDGTVSFSGHLRVAQGTFEAGIDCSAVSSGAEIHITGGDLLAWAYPVN